MPIAGKIHQRNCARLVKGALLCTKSGGGKSGSFGDAVGRLASDSLVSVCSQPTIKTCSLGMELDPVCLAGGGEGQYLAHLNG